MYNEVDIRAALMLHLSAQKGLDQADVWALTNRIMKTLKETEDPE